MGKEELIATCSLPGEGASLGSGFPSVLSGERLEEGGRWHPGLPALGL